MLSQLDRSRAHAALADLWANPDDPRREAYAGIITLHAGDPELPKMLLLFDLLDMVCAGAVEIDYPSLLTATGLDGDAIELVLTAAGARERGIRDWTTAGDSEKAERFTLTRDQWREVTLIALDF